MIDERLHSVTFTWRDQLALYAASRELTGLALLEAIASGELPGPLIGALFDLQIESVERGRVVFRAQPGPYHSNPMGSVHGGFAATLFDTALGCAIQSTADAGVACPTVDLHVRYTRPIMLDGGPVRCAAEIVHVGRTIATAEARMTDLSGKLYGHATISCAIVAPRA